MHHPLSTRALAALAALAFTACSGRNTSTQTVTQPPPHTAQPETTPPVETTVQVATPPPVPDVQEDTSTPAGVARTRLPARSGVQLAAPWPGAGGFDDAIGVFATIPEPAPGTRFTPVITWVRRSVAEPTPRPMGYPADGIEVEALGAADVNADGRDELLVFLRRGALDAANTVAVFDLPAGRDQPNLQDVESAALDGARTLEQVRARLPLSRGITPADVEGATTTSLVGRLAFATQAQFAALVHPQFERCRVEYDHPGGHATRRCSRLAVARMTATRFDLDVRALIRDSLDALSILTFECATTPQEQCTAQRSGGYSTGFEFDGTGAARRLRRIVTTDQGLGE